MTRVAFYNLGCKVNQFDAAAMESVLQEEGGYTSVPFGEEADVYVVNTCTVTGKSDHEARQAIRRAVRLNRNAKVVVTGCYAQTHPEEIAKIEGVSLILGNVEKFYLKEHLKTLVHSCTPVSQGKGPMVFVGNIHGNSPLRQPEISGFPFKTRAFLKVQDGCNLRCSFCIIPEARGESRSLPLARVVEQVTVLEGEGYQEVILTGIHLGSYGRDLDPRTALPKLLEALLRETRIPRIRLSSIEPREVTDELIGIMAGSDRICRHLHIPLQSGDDQILRHMNRNYTVSFYEDRIRAAVRQFPRLGLGTDVMVGFPGEGETHFENTRRLIDRLPFTYLHVFPYSPRSGTGAAHLRDDVPRSEKHRRGEALRVLGEKKKEAYLSGFMGETLRVLLEAEPGDLSKGWGGYSDNYLRVRVWPADDDGREKSAAGGLAPNRLIPVAIRGILKEEGALAGVWPPPPPQKPHSPVR